MFCPKCGNADQTPETYCRQCGVFLPDLSKPLKSRQTPEDHVKANLVLNAMTVVVCFTLAILLFAILPREDTHPLIYATAGLMIAMGCWHVQTLWRTLLLRKHFKKAAPPQEMTIEGGNGKDHLLEMPDFENMVPASVTDRTTKHLSETKLKSS